MADGLRATAASFELPLHERGNDGSNDGHQQHVDPEACDALQQRKVRPMNPVPVALSIRQTAK
jgi:hypothetical protein